MGNMSVRNVRGVYTAVRGETVIHVSLALIHTDTHNSGVAFTQAKFGMV